MQKKEIETFYPANRKKWRQWLQKHHDKKQSVWLIGYKKSAAKPTISWSDSVDEALCFGWIDSTRKSLDDESFIQFFTRRKPTSTWSKINKDKVKRLIDEGLMTEAGLKTIAIAKENGTWELMDTVERLEIPKDLEKQFKAHPGSRKFFMSLSRSAKKMLLHWLATAKREETRQKRVKEIAEQAAKQQKPKQFS